MSEPDIAPLAKRLAEENNVNWRQLKGSGPGGRVVERDVLEYLARVMAGEEAVDPTPEPLPEGMAHWPGQDIPRSVKEPEDDFDEVHFAEPETRLARDAALAAEPPIIVEAEPSAAEPAIDEDIFLFDDEEAAPRPKVWDEADEGWAGATEEPTVYGVPVREEHREDEVVVPPRDDDWPLPVERDEDELIWADADDGVAGPAREPVVGAPERHEPRDRDGWAEVDQAPALEVVAEDLPSEAADTLSSAPPEPVVTVQDESEGDIQAQQEALPSEQKAAEPDAAAVPVPHETFAPRFADASIDASTPAIIPGTLPLVSYGVLLRQHLNLTALAEAQRAVGRELSGGTPIAPTAFLVRAAAKALRREPFGPDRSVALAVLSKRGLGARRMEKVELLPFSQLVAAVNEARASETTEIEPAALLVADMSEYALDEAVLKAGMPVLTLGRILYDSSEGSYHSTLSLSGEFVAAIGARLLGEVAALLDSPVQLVL